MGGLALMAALRHRDRTGIGQHIDLSQSEASTIFVGEAIVDAQITGIDRGRRANEHLAMVPHDMWPCRGDDRWLAVACRSDEEWSVLWNLIGRPGGGEVTPFPTLAERRENITVIDGWIAGWTRDRDDLSVMHELLELGIPAGAMMNAVDLLADQHLAAREFWLAQERDEIGVKHHPTEPFRYASSPLPHARHAPYLGEFNHVVLCDELGLSETEYEALQRDEVIGNAPIGPNATVLRV
jgi:crotonobetainyl-CoA:carnitine CoA-transferase CaiB-like acyl-CoA transferase